MRRRIDFPRSRLPVSSVLSASRRIWKQAREIYRDRRQTDTFTEIIPLSIPSLKMEGRRKKGPSVFNHPVGHDVLTGIYGYQQNITLKTMQPQHSVLRWCKPANVWSFRSSVCPTVSRRACLFLQLGRGRWAAAGARRHLRWVTAEGCPWRTCSPWPSPPCQQQM